MPNRVVREGILDSERIDKLTWPSEIFYRRLMSIVDDFGRGDGRMDILRAKLYPKKLNKVSEADIAKWIHECEEAELVSRYEVDSKPFIEIFDFGQSLRKMISAFPNKDGVYETKDEYIERMNAIDRKGFQPRPETKGIESESNQKKGSLIEIFFNDLPNSSYLSNISIGISVPIDELKKAIPDFKKHANLEYPSMVKFSEHFKNWYLKKSKDELQKGQKTTITSLKFGGRK